jgi:dihydrofolate reductase
MAPRVTYRTATTANGFIADENHSLSWLFASEHDGRQKADHESFLDGIGALVQGSSTYEWVLREENLIEEPGPWPEYFGDRPTFVFTSRELPKPEGADVRFVNGDVSDHLAAIDAAAGDLGIWLVGGGELAGQFFDAGRLDQIDLAWAPAMLPGGAPLLPRRIEPDRLRLKGCEQRNQFVEATYQFSEHFSFLRNEKCSVAGRVERVEPGRREHRRHVARVVRDEALRQLAGRPVLDRRAEVGHRHRQTDRGRDLEVGGVRRLAADRPRGNQGVDPVEHRGEGAEGGDRVVVGGFVEAGREGHDRRRRLHREPDREPDLGALRVAPQRLLVVLHPPPEDLADRVLQILVAEALGLLDRGAGGRVGGEEGRLGDEAVEGAGDRP